MIRAGHVITNPSSKTTITVLETDVETKGMGFYLEYHMPVGARPDVAEHLHMTWTETFEIISGECKYRLDGKKRNAKAGDVVLLPPTQKHIHPWNNGQTELVMRQRSQFDKPSPQAVQDTLGVFSTIADLGPNQLNANGQPKNALLSFAILRTLGKHGGYDGRIPIRTQKILNATVGLLAELIGVRAVSKKYR